MQSLQDIVALAARILLALIFMIEGWLKVTNYAGTVSYMEANAVPGILLPLVILTELGGGLLVAAGLMTRIAAFGLAGFCLATALLFHHDIADTGQFIHFLKNVAMAGGFLMLVAFGAGGWSLDRWFRRP